MHSLYSKERERVAAVISPSLTVIMVWIVGEWVRAGCRSLIRIWIIWAQQGDSTKHTTGWMEVSRQIQISWCLPPNIYLPSSTRQKIWDFGREHGFYRRPTACTNNWRPSLSRDPVAATSAASHLPTLSTTPKLFDIMSLADRVKEEVRKIHKMVDGGGWRMTNDKYRELSGCMGQRRHSINKSIYFCSQCCDDHDSIVPYLLLSHSSCFWFPNFDGHSRLSTPTPTLISRCKNNTPMQ